MWEQIVNLAISNGLFAVLFLGLLIYQLKDTYNYLVSYSAFIRCSGELPMSEYVAARDIKDKIKNELEEFFNSVDCEYKQINIKSLV